MDHSVRAYLERIPLEKLKTLFEDGFIEDGYAVNDRILQDILEVLISRNTEPGSDLSTYIQDIEEIQVKRKQTEQSTEGV